MDHANDFLGGLYSRSALDNFL